MRNIILSAHSRFFRKYSKVLMRPRHGNIVVWAACKAADRLFRIVFYCYMAVYKVFGSLPAALDGKGDVIVSLTSFPKRIGSLWMVIDSIMRQSTRPAQVQLYLAKDEFPDGKDGLPKRLLKYIDLGLDVRFKEDNLMSHKKYFYALRENKGKLVVTVDDDCYYHPTTIGNLLKTHRAHPRCVCCNTLKVIRHDNGAALPYAEWYRPAAEDIIGEDIANIAIGFNGVLYPTELFEEAELMFDVDTIRECAPRADDLWLKAVELIHGIGIAGGDFMCPGISILGSQVVALYSTNTGANAQNDIQWKQLDERFGLRKMLCRETKPL